MGTSKKRISRGVFGVKHGSKKKSGAAHVWLIRPELAMENAMRPTFDDFLRFAVDHPGNVTPRLSWADFALYLSRRIPQAQEWFNKALLDLEQAAGEEDEGEPDQKRYARSEKKRIEANILALRVLRGMQARGAVEPTAEERDRLWAYSGWGGINPAKLPLDETAFPPDFLSAIKQWQTAVARASIPTTNLFQGLRHQFFTPPEVCQAMWALARRVVIGAIDTAIEPSAGSGRFLQATPRKLDVVWTAVEADGLLSQILTAGHPQAVVYAESFEEHFAAWEGTPSGERPYYSLVLMNPPYPDRPEKDRKKDPGGASWTKAHAYFVERASRMLRPGGALVAITPAGEIIGVDQENRRLRTALLAECHFAGAFFPPSNIFPDVDPLNNAFAIHAWVKLSGPRALSDEDHQIVKGLYGDIEENTAGTWREYGGRKTVQGEFRLKQVKEMRLRPLPVQDQAEILQAYASRGASKKGKGKASTPAAQATRASPSRRVDLAAMTRADADAVDAGQAMALRLQRFAAMVAQRGYEAARAEEGRAELVRDLQTYQNRYGNPHENPDVVARAEMAPLLAAIPRSGDVALTLQREVSEYAFSAPPETGSPRELVYWYNQHRGVCTDRDLAAYGYPDAVDVMVSDPDVAVEPQPDGGFWYYWLKPEVREYPRVDGVTGEPVLDSSGQAIIDQEVTPPTYLTGSMHYRLERIDIALGDTADPALRAKLEEQKAQVLLALPNTSVTTIRPTPRSGLIPTECLQDYINDILRIQFQVRDPRITVYIEQARLKVRTNDSLSVVESVGQAGRWLREILAYWNRESTTVDPDERETKRTNLYGGMEVGTRLEIEQKIEEDFQGWLATHETWPAQIEAAYAVEHGTITQRDYDESPLGIARMSPNFVPGGHQNASVRRLTDQAAGIVNVAVGGGKTAIGLLTAAWWRQTNRSQRTLAVVPNNVLFNWFRECRWILPDYRVGIVGWSIDPVEGVKRQDTPDDRVVKWSRFVQGDYDLLLCPYSNFLNDIAMRDETLLDMLSQVFWLERGVGIDAEDRALYKRKLDAAKAKRADLQTDLARETNTLTTARAQGWASARLEQALGKMEAQIEKVGADIERLEEQLKAPSATVIADVQQDIEDLAGKKPFRPRTRMDAGWKPAWDVRALRSFADARGLVFQEDGSVWLTEDYAPPDHLSDEVRAWLSELDQTPAGVLVREPGRTSKKVVVELLNAFFPRPPAGPAVPRPPLVYWEDLGVELLIVDEAHNFKNTWYAEARVGAKVEYMGSGSTMDMGPQAWDMYWKCQDLVNRRKGGVVLLTATVLKNSPLEVYNLVSMVAPNAWKARGVRSHEEFIDRYCKLDLAIIPKSNGDFKEALSMESWRDDTRAELLRVLDQYIDRRTIGELLRRGVIRSVPLPRIIRDESDLDPIADALYDIVVEQTEEIIAAIKKEQGEDMRQLVGAVTLMFLDLLRKITVDPRLLTTHLAEVEAHLAMGRRSAGGEPLSEVQIRALQIRANLLREHCQAHTLVDRYRGFTLPKYERLAHRVINADGCKHVIFSDYNETHQYIREALVQIAGVDPDRIAIMTGALDPEERQALALAYCGSPAEMDILTGTTVERPEIPSTYDVIIGNSSVMAEGLNLQRGTCAIHHLTLPWEPATLEQRNGRGVRQGNDMGIVDILYYMSRHSFDGIQLDKVLGKVGWIEQLYEPEARNTGNPLAGAKFSRTELMLLITMRKEPEEARKRAAEIEEQQRAYRLARAQRAAYDAFSLVVVDYARARRAEAEATRKALFSMTDVKASNLRNLSDDVFPFKFLLDIARTKAVIIMSDSLYVVEGERACFRDSTKPDRIQRIKIEGIQERTRVIRYRYTGDPLLRTAYGAGALLPTIAGGEWVRDESCFWDDREDYVAIMTNVPNLAELPRWDPQVIQHFGLPVLWMRMREAAKAGNTAYLRPGKDSTIPLKDASGQVLLLTPGAERRFSYSESAQLEGFSPMIPQDPTSWTHFLKALGQDNVTIGLPGRASRPLQMTKEDRALLDSTLIYWFNVGFGSGVRLINTALRAVRRLRGESESPE